MYILEELFKMKRVFDEECKLSRLSERRQTKTKNWTDVIKNKLKIIRKGSSIVLKELESEKVKPDFTKVRKANKSYSL